MAAEGKAGEAGREEEDARMSSIALEVCLGVEGLEADVALRDGVTKQKYQKLSVMKAKKKQAETWSKTKKKNTYVT